MDTASAGPKTIRLSQSLPAWFAVVALIIGTGFVFVNPPLKSPDEMPHFARAYDLSRFHPFLKIQDGFLGTESPVSLRKLQQTFLMVSYNGASVSKTFDARRIRLNPDVTFFYYHHNIAVYPFLPFVPQAIGIAVGRLFTQSILDLLYFAREFNLIAYVAVVYAAVRWMPANGPRFGLAVVGLVPMSLYLASSASGDALTIAAAIFTVATFWRIAFSSEPASGFEIAVLFASTIVLSLSKLAYWPMAMMALAIPPSRFSDNRRYVLIISALLLSNALAVTLWMWQFHAMPTITVDSFVNPTLQRQYILHHADRILPIVAKTVRFYGWEIATGVIGVFGWAEIGLPSVLVIIYYLLLPISVASNFPRLDRRGAIVAGCVAILEMALIFGAYYVEWRPVGESPVQGFQGRYFIPLLPMLVLFAKPKAPARSQRLLFILAACIGVCAVLFLAQQLYPAFPASRFYYRFSNR